MAVTINLAAYLRQYADNNENVTVEGRTVKECLDDLFEQYPQLKDFVFDKAGVLHNYVSLFTGGEIVYPDKLDKPVIDGATVHILYIIGGG